MRIYLISLEQDTQRRNELARRFPQTYPKMQWVQAVNGKNLPAKEYFTYAQEYFKTHQKIITPSEVGCTLSHIKALETFLETDDEHCLILEDDVIGTDADICKIENEFSNKSLNGVVLCGGQIACDAEKYRLYKNIDDEIFIIAEFSKKFFYGTCCYLVNRWIAKTIIAFQKNSITKADCWNEILGRDINLYYVNILQHPVFMGNSHIESERSFFYTKEKRFFKRIYKQGLFWKIHNRLRNDIYRWVLILKGYKQIHKDKP